MERDDEVMVDRGFQEDSRRFTFSFCRLVVPIGATVKRQMTKSEVKQTKEVVNLRLHFERTINWITFLWF